MYLCCDLGGSNSDWAVFNPKNLECIYRRQISNRDFYDFYGILDEFLSSYSLLSDHPTITFSTLGIAGRIDGSRVSLTNIEGWDVSLDTVNSTLSDHGHAPESVLINDFEAIGYGILYLNEHGFDKDDIVEVHGRFRPGASRTGESPRSRSVICGPGTGLGVSCLVDGLMKDGLPFILSSEGGHHSFAPETADQYRVFGGSEKFTGKTSYESVLSKRGLVNLYNMYRKTYGSAEADYNVEAEKIIELSTRNGDQAAIDAVDLFVSILANFCGNIALTFNCDKAVYLWGATLPKIPSALLSARFKIIYPDRCGHRERIARVPVVLVRNPEIPLLGCAYRSTFG
jgi:glucokinase